MSHPLYRCQNWMDGCEEQPDTVYVQEVYVGGVYHSTVYGTACKAHAEKLGRVLPGGLNNRPHPDRYYCDDDSREHWHDWAGRSTAVLPDGSVIF